MRRRETKLLVHHGGAGTPDRLFVRKLASDHFNAPMDRVFVRSISTRTGGSSALCAVEVYDDKETANLIVPPFLKNRNLPKEERVSKSKKQEEPKAAAPTKPSPTTKPSPPTKGPSGEKPAPSAAQTPRKPESSTAKEAKPSTRPDSQPKAQPSPGQGS